MLTDTHCHVDYPSLLDDLPGVLARAHAAGVSRMVTISTHVARVERYRALAEQHADIWFTVGTHPHYAHEEPDVSVADLVALSAHPRCVGVGEAGLDYHYDLSPREAQMAGLVRHIAAARETGLPIVIHARSADADMITVLEREMAAGAFTGVLHCFSSGAELARRGAALGLMVSFSGILTFKASEELRAIAAEVPLPQLLVETDAPYLAPVPHRGRSNEPAFVRHTAEALAAVRGMSLAALAPILAANSERLFWRMTGASARAAA
jgi:TatD DNase family protein